MYESLIRPLNEYASTVWHLGLNVKQKKKLQRQENFALKMLGIKLNYTLDQRRVEKCCNKYNQIESQSSNVLFNFISQKLPRSGHYRVPKCNTERCKNSFFFKTPVLLNSKL